MNNFSPRENNIHDFEKWRKSTIQETSKGYKIDKLVMPIEAAKFLQISESTLKKKRLLNKLPYVSFPGGRKIRYEISELYLRIVNSALEERQSSIDSHLHRDTYFLKLNDLYLARKQYQMELVNIDLSIGQTARILRVPEQYLHKLKDLSNGNKRPAHFTLHYRDGSYFFPINSILKFIHRHRVPAFVQ